MKSHLILFNLLINFIRFSNGFGAEHSAEKKRKVLTDLEEFDEIFPELVALLINDESKDPERKDAGRWFKEVVNTLIIFDFLFCLGLEQILNFFIPNTNRFLPIPRLRICSTT